MKKLTEMSREELSQFYTQTESAYTAFKLRGLQLNMARGKPSQEQLDLTRNLHQPITDFLDEDGDDVRNYGKLLGIPEARRLFGEILQVPSSQVIAGGVSSLNLMYDMICRAYIYGVLPQYTPWRLLPQVKFLCPVPGYDRHFAITESLGFTHIPVPMHDDGPDMDMIDRLVAEDDSIKGIWCVPMYSNPDGITYSDAVVRRFAALKPAAADFRIFWDNAYCVHHLYPNQPERQDHLLSIYEACQEQGSEDMVYLFASTSKITMASAGISAMAMSPANFVWTVEKLSLQTIGYNRVNQLMHARYMPDLSSVEQVMSRHADLLRPRFELVLNKLQAEISPLGIAQWRKPRGGYFISFFALPGTARRVVALCKEAGLVLTGAGATYPGGHDPLDSNIRLAPSYPSLQELERAMELFCVCVKLAAAERLLAQ